jgi:ribose transport system substrate-binding protein
MPLSKGRIRYGLGLLIVPLIAAACSSTPSGSSSTTTTTPGGSGGNSQVAAANAVIADAVNGIAKINVTVPLPHAPAKGIKVGFINGNLSSQEINGDQFSTAATALGWDPQVFTYDPTNPQSIGQAIEQAISAKVKYLAINGTNSPAYATALAAAKAAGIPFVQINVVNESGAAGKGIAACVSCDSSLDQWTKLIVNWITVNSNDKANVLWVDVPEFISNTYEQTQLENGFKADCSGCTMSTLSVTLTDLSNGSIPQTVASYLESHPNIDYLAFPFGQVGDDVRTTLNTAGIGKNVKIVTLYPDLAETQDVIAGNIQAAMVFGGGEQMFDALDAMARMSEGMSPAASEVASTTDIWTPSSVPKPAAIFQGPPNYQQQFKTLWKVG